jgi:hypothetical protein
MSDIYAAMKTVSIHIYIRIASFNLRRNSITAWKFTRTLNRLYKFLETYYKFLEWGRD